MRKILYSLLFLLVPIAVFPADKKAPDNDPFAALKPLYRAIEEEIQPRLRSGDYLGAVEIAREYIRKEQDANRIAFLLDLSASYIATLGDSASARKSMDRALNIYSRHRGVRAFGPQWGPVRKQVRWQAPDKILRKAAENHSVILISEAHHVPETRAFGRAVLPLLKKLGYEYFAMETLKHPVPADAVKVHMSTGPKTAAGYYFMEPQMAGLVRTALKLGFKLIAYEDEGVGNDREKEQAKNIYERLLRDKPDAKLVVWAGYGHVYKRKWENQKMMGAWLWEMTGREPYSLYQVFDTLDPYMTGKYFYKPLVLDDPNRPRKTLVLENKKGLFPKLDELEDNDLDRDKDGNPIVDAYVVHPPFQAAPSGGLRPTWMDGKGLHKVTGEVSGEAEGRTLIQAFPAGEGTASSPADQMVFYAPGAYELRLAKGDYLIVLRDAQGRVLAETKAGVRSHMSKNISIY